MAKIISFVSEKGGVGKTTVVYNIAGVIGSKINKKVCVIDLDPQQNLSQAFHFVADGHPTVAELIYSTVADFPIVSEAEMTDVIRHSDYGVDYIPAGKKMLSKLPTLIDDDIYVIKKMLDNDIFKDYDYIFLDCKNSLDKYLVPEAMVASDYVVAVTDCGQFSFYGVQPVLNAIADIRKAHNSNLKLAGIAINKCTPNTLIGREVTEALKEGYESNVIDVVIPFRYSQAENSLSEQRPCCLAKRNTLSDVFKMLTMELIKRIGD